MVTIELDPIADGRLPEYSRDLADVTRRLIELMDAVRLPATWAVSDPAHSAATPLIVRSPVPHELAILGDPNWIGPTAGRTRFARELVRRISQARAAGLDVATLVPRTATIERHMDLIVKQRITAIAGDADPARATRQSTAPRALHYGVWEMPATGTLPVLRSSWWNWSGLTTWRAIRRAARDAATYHLIIDAPSVARNRRWAENKVSRVMRRVATLRERGLVHVETLRAAAARLSDVPAITPQQSILRRAA
jgi:hypothetical protein